MPSDIRIFLVRHGESEANLDKTVNQRLADTKIALSPKGGEQARAAGGKIAEWYGEAGRMRGPIRIWQSPYQRTRETAAAIAAGLEAAGLAFDLRESIHLRELEFGLFDGVPDEELPARFPLEHALYEKLKRFEGEVFARMPMGESRIDVCQRVHQFFGTLHRDAERHSIRDVIVVSHGVTVRAFAMMWLGLSYEWLEREPNPGNCSIRLIEGEDISWLDLGSKPAKKTAQETREAGVITDATAS